MNNVRVRFAPSPTGPLHIGGVRTALFNYLFAKKHSGTFILRIEDTDQTRYVANAEQYIIDALNWCNIPFDEGPGKNEKFGPYRQSERKHIYKKYAEELIAKGKAYYAFDTAEDLDFHRKDHEEKGKTFIYNWHNREKLTNSISLSKEEVEKRIVNGDNYVVRFKMYEPESENEIIEVNDIIRGNVSFKKEILDDKILFKSDGMPTYHLANIVDDHLMEISHVIRGEEWLPSLPLHIALYEAFNWKAPEFAHLPLILKPVGKGKLSKRDGDKLGFPVFPLEYKNEATGEISRGYKEDGYFADAFINMLALLGWNPGTEQEIFALEDLCKTFTLERVSKSGAKFSPDKTKWFNQQYMMLKTDEELAEFFVPILKKHVIANEMKQPLEVERLPRCYAPRNDNEEFNMEYITKVVSSIKERATFVYDFWDLSSFFFEAPTQYDEKAAKKQWKEDTSELMKELISVISTIEDFTSHTIELIVKEWITSKEIGFGKVMQPFRLSLVGAMKGPHLFDIAEMIGKEETLSRIKKAIDTL
ncbi:glutamate--tRNA ligase [Lutibacter sp. B1]|uniref:glutamate--tRNA ligase n=1 Tax=Lutibacter sp. B1 TaxID=2725996 RepID=UPI0014571267|nr:glutamate--tRNA ligase [Lutibacter sp. B1]NLP59078.1 glutamate--tRNA ligase [Lutibacter sp. B1]